MRSSIVVMLDITSVAFSIWELKFERIIANYVINCSFFKKAFYNRIMEHNLMTSNKLNTRKTSISFSFLFL